MSRHRERYGDRRGRGGHGDGGVGRLGDTSGAEMASRPEPSDRGYVCKGGGVSERRRVTAHGVRMGELCLRLLLVVAFFCFCAGVVACACWACLLAASWLPFSRPPLLPAPLRSRFESSDAALASLERADYLDELASKSLLDARERGGANVTSVLDVM